MGNCCHLYRLNAREKWTGETFMQMSSCTLCRWQIICESAIDDGAWKRRVTARISEWIFVSNIRVKFAISKPTWQEQISCVNGFIPMTYFSSVLYFYAYKICYACVCVCSIFQWQSSSSVDNIDNIVQIVSNVESEDCIWQIAFYTQVIGALAFK